MDLEKVIIKKGKKLLILNLILILITGAVWYYLFNQKEFVNLFKPAKEIRTYDELNVARYNSTYVKVYFTDVYTTNYVYKYDGRVVGEYLDFDMEGYSLIGLVSKADAEKIMNGSQDYVEGKLEVFTDENKKVYDNIVKNYVSENKSEEYSEAELKSIFLPIQLNNYNEDSSKVFSYIIIIFVGIIDIACFICIIKAIKRITKPFAKYKNNEEFIEKVKEEYSSDNFAYKFNNFYISNNYMFYESAYNVEIYKISDIAWTYYRIVKQNGITTFKGTAFRLLNKKYVQIPVQDENIFKVLYDKNNNILIGFTSENSKKYKEMVKEYKREGKNEI